MSGKGRVKDLVEKLNGHLNCEAKRFSEHQKPVQNSQLRNKHSQNGTSLVNDLVALNTKDKIQKIENTNINNDLKGESEKSDYDDNDNNWIKVTGTDTFHKMLSDRYKSLQKAHYRLKQKYSEEEEKRLAAEIELRSTKSEQPIRKNHKEDIHYLHEKETRLQNEVQELREQNELLEFRLLELEYLNTNGNKTETGIMEEITERDDISDSGVMSLSPCEDFYSECDLTDIKLDEEEPWVTGQEVQQKLNRMFQYADNTYDKITLQQTLDLIKHYQMRITGMESTLTNMCQERINQHSDEFLTSLKNPDECTKSKTNRIVATVSPFSNQFGKNPSESRSQDISSEKLFLEIDRLQESGIFDEFPGDLDIMERKSTESQTDDIIHESIKISECSGSVLVEELSKLEKVKKRIQERDNQKSFSSEENKICAKNVPNSVLNSKELSYYKKQYELLKSKVSAYEGSSDSKTKQLTDKLHKENELENRVKYLTNKVTKLETDMKKLEEEKCEYEEAENDARLRCQKLEVKLYALAEKKNDFQFHLQKHVRIVSNLKNNVAELEKKKEAAYEKTYQMEIAINEYEERNFELEERLMDVKYRLQVLESALPAIIYWNLFTFVSSFQNIIRALSKALPEPTVSLVPSSMLESRNAELKEGIHKLELDLREKQNIIRKLEDYELELRSRINDLQENMKYLNSKDVSLPEAQKDSSKVAKACLPEQHRLKEEVYVQTLHQADEIITNMENEFKRKLEEIKSILSDKCCKLEECERKLASVSLIREIENHLTEKIQTLEAEIVSLKHILRLKDDEKVAWLQNEKCLHEELDNANATLILFKENEETIKKKLEEERNLNKEQKREMEFRKNAFDDLEQNYIDQIKKLEKRIQRLAREIENQEVTNSELKEEVETLEGTICELNLSLNIEKDEKEKMLIKFRQELVSKQEEVDSLKRLSQDMTAISTAQEISLVQSKSHSVLTNKYSNSLPKIVSADRKSVYKNDSLLSFNGKPNFVSEKNYKSESSAHVIKHKDSYTILLKPVPVELYNNFEVSVNNYNLSSVENSKASRLAGIINETDSVSITVKPMSAIKGTYQI